MKTIYRLLIALCLSLQLCGPVMAQHEGPYLGASFGGHMLSDAKSIDGQGTFNLKYKHGLQGSIVAGWELKPNNPVGEGRIELEYARRSSPLDTVEFVEGDFKGNGSMTVDSLLLNCIGVNRGNSHWGQYVVIGFGAAHFDASGLKVSGTPLSNDSDNVFAYQLGGGIDVALSESLTLDIGYRFFNSIKPQFTERNGDRFETNYLNHSVIFGLRMGF